MLYYLISCDSQSCFREVETVGEQTFWNVPDRVDPLDSLVVREGPSGRFSKIVKLPLGASSVEGHYALGGHMTPCPPGDANPEDCPSLVGSSNPYRVHLETN